ncbi:RNA polymerase sigma factor [Desertivirga brevis]|uniref:RNA polymerase sigma factor n=1 Tax=Desertivirga brevis TaxID=2810310 RepID=UPI001A965CB5|nr:RNA polymerase sigma-70 factor [Pedobacter sp. SYSU D00873]
MDDKEELLLQQIKNGDGLRGYEQIFKHYYKGIVLEAFYILKDEMEAEDLVQSFFLEAWEKQILGNINTSLRSYLHTAVRNRCFNLLEKRKTEEKRLNSFLDTLDEFSVNPDLERKEFSKRLELMLAALPKQRLEVVNLVYLEEKKYQEAASAMGISINSVKTHLKLALKSLRSKLNSLI